VEGLRAALAALVVAVVAALASASPAAAITGGTVDTTGRYAQVGLIAFYDGTGRYRCSAALVSPTVLLTAAHCTEGTVGSTAVTFLATVAERPPSPLPAAADPAAGYTASELAAAGWLSGTAHTHPAYSGFTDLAHWNDVGVVVLDEPVAGLTPLPLAPTGYLDQFTPRVLNRTAFTAVGYGTEVRKAETGPQKPTPMSYPIVRRYTDSVGQKLTPQVLQANGNPNDVRAGGGTCSGDSGGPVLHDGQVVAVVSYGYTANCRYLDGYQRVEVPVVQDWLAGFAVAAAERSAA